MFEGADFGLQLFNELWRITGRFKFEDFVVKELFFMSTFSIFLFLDKFFIRVGRIERFID